MAMCGNCGKFVRFVVQRHTQDRMEKLKTLPAESKRWKWHQFDDYTWLCEKC